MTSVPDVITPPAGILFDAGGTLVQPNVHRIAARLAAMADGSPTPTAGTMTAGTTTPGTASPDADALDVALWRAMNRFDTTYGPGAGDPAEWIPRWLAEMAADVGVDRSAFLAAWHAEDGRAHLWDQPIEGVEPALRRLSAAGLPVGVVSNSDGRVEDALERAGLAAHFPVIVDSGVVGVAKPDPRIFDTALAALDLDPARTWYVGDTVVYDVAAADAAGLTSWIVDHRGQHTHGHPRTVASLGALADVALDDAVEG